MNVKYKLQESISRWFLKYALGRTGVEARHRGLEYQTKSFFIEDRKLGVCFLEIPLNTTTCGKVECSISIIIFSKLVNTQKKTPDGRNMSRTNIKPCCYSIEKCYAVNSMIKKAAQTEIVLRFEDE